MTAQYNVFVNGLFYGRGPLEYVHELTSDRQAFGADDVIEIKKLCGGDTMKEPETISNIGLVFENCESIIIPVERIDRLFVSGVKDSFSISHGTLYEGQESEFVLLSIKIERMSEIDCDTSSMILHEPDNKVADNPQILSRIEAHNDITHVKLLDSEMNILKHVEVPFEGDWSNNLMRTEYCDIFNTLNIYIGKEHD